VPTNPGPLNSVYADKNLFIRSPLIPQVKGEVPALQREIRKARINNEGVVALTTPLHPSRDPIYSSTKIFLPTHISFRIFGHTVTLTSPRWALRSNSIKVRDCPIPPPIESGISLFRIAW